MDIKKNLADVFGVPNPVKTPNIIDVPVVAEKTTELAKPSEISEGYDFATKHLKDLAKIAIDAVKTNVEMADQLQEPRMYNTLTESIRAAKEIATELATLESEKKKIELAKAKLEGTSNGPNVQNNAIFIGTATDLLDLLNPDRALNKEE